MPEPASVPASVHGSVEQWLQHGGVMADTLHALLFLNVTAHNLSSSSSNPELAASPAGHQQRVYLRLLEEFRASLVVAGEPASVALICLYVPVFLLALAGNLLVLLVVLPNRTMRSVTNYFIVNMALSDLLVTVICIPMAVGERIYRPWIYGAFMCKITNYVQGVAVSSSVLTIMALSVDRYLAIRHPMTFRAFSAGGHAWKVVLLIWLLSFAIMIPLILVRQLQAVDIIPSQVYYFCHELWSQPAHRQAYDGVLFLCLFILPGCFVSASYSRIGCQLWTEGRDTGLYRTDSAHGKQQAQRIMSGRRRVARMLIVLALLFALCWTPYHALSLYIDFLPRTLQPHTALNALPFTILLGHSNSALNPVLYCFMNKSFRKCAKKIICCKKKTKHKPESPVNLVVCYNRLAGGSQRGALTSHQQRPLVRGGVSTSSRSTSGSLKFSRSSGSWRCISKSTNTSTSLRALSMIPMKTVRSLVETMHSSIDSDAYMTASDSGSPNSPYGDSDDSKSAPRKRREIFNYTLSIPTTINEESRSISRTPSPTPTIERLGMLGTLMEEERSKGTSKDAPREVFKESLRDLLVGGEGEELSDTDDSGKGSIVLEEFPAPCLIPTVIVTDEVTGERMGEASHNPQANNPALYEEPLFHLFPDHSDATVPAEEAEESDLQAVLIGDHASPVQVILADSLEG